MGGRVVEYNLVRGMEDWLPIRIQRVQGGDRASGGGFNAFIEHGQEMNLDCKCFS